MADSYDSPCCAECRAPDQHVDPPDADPATISELWLTVFKRLQASSHPHHHDAIHVSAAMTTRSPRKSTRSRGSPAKQPPPPPPGPASLLTPPATELKPDESASNILPPPPAAPSTITIRNRDFEDTILVPRRLRVLRERKLTTPYKHFATQEVRYRDLAGLETANVWVDQADAKAIAAEYQAMCQAKYLEVHYQFYALRVLLRNESCAEKSEASRQTRAEQMFGSPCKPNPDEHWHGPPILDEAHVSVKTYDWDARVDTTYWLQLRAFNEEYRHHIGDVTYVHRDMNITCPYLTIEFKRDDGEEDQAIRQLLVSSSIALHNRWRLHHRATAPDSYDSPPQESRHVKHYGLTFCSHTCTVYVLEPELRGSTPSHWNGCTMTRLVTLDCRMEPQVRKLVQWINEIHRWGLTSHFEACQREVKVVIEREVDLSTLSMEDHVE